MTQAPSPPVLSAELRLKCAEACRDDASLIDWMPDYSYRDWQALVLKLAQLLKERAEHDLAEECFIDALATNSVDDLQLLLIELLENGDE
jgi:hypothetical protein